MAAANSSKGKKKVGAAPGAFRAACGGARGRPGQWKRPGAALGPLGRPPRRGAQIAAPPRPPRPAEMEQGQGEGEGQQPGAVRPGAGGGLREGCWVRRQAAGGAAARCAAPTLRCARARAPAAAAARRRCTGRMGVGASGCVAAAGAAACLHCSSLSQASRCAGAPAADAARGAWGRRQGWRGAGGSCVKSAPLHTTQPPRRLAARSQAGRRRGPAAGRRGSRPRALAAASPSQPQPPLHRHKPPKGHLRQAHRRGAQVQDDHPLHPVRPPAGASAAGRSPGARGRGWASAQAAEAETAGGDGGWGRPRRWRAAWRTSSCRPACAAGAALGTPSPPPCLPADTSPTCPPPCPLPHTQLNGSLARTAIRELLTKGLIKPVAESAHQKIYTRAVGA
jgi:hypothetical protein